VLAGESDSGAGPAFALRLPAGAEAKPELASLRGLLAPIRVFVAREAATGAGADTAGLQALGVPVFSIRLDMSRYFDWHHSADDTLDKVDRKDLAQAVAAWTTFLYLVADSAVDFRPPPAPAAR
jgi:Zn-dependent M28 family amino/carboxypeptidase